MLRWLSSRPRPYWCRLVAGCVFILPWSATTAAQLHAPQASGKLLPEYPRLRLELPRWTPDHANSSRPPPLELSIDVLGPAELTGPGEFRAEKTLWRLSPFGAYALQERVSRTEACLDVVGWCDLDGGWRSALDLRIDASDVMPMPASYVMRLEWLSMQRSSGGSVSSSRFFQGLRGEF